MITIKEICSKLWHIEQQHSLNNRQIQRVYFWNLIRFQVFRSLSKQYLNYGQAHGMRQSKFEFFKRSIPFTLNAMKKNPLKNRYNVDLLIFNHPRKVKVNNDFIDIYTNYFKNNLESQSYEIIESPYYLKHYGKKNNKVKYLDTMFITNFLKGIFYQVSISREEKEYISYLQYQLDEDFPNNNIDLYNLIMLRLKKFKLKYYFYYKLLEKRQPQKIYCVVSYNYQPLIAAAQDLKIEVIEFQHGVITDYHFAYNFADPNEYIPYFPDKLLTFGEYWAKTEGFPKQTEVEVYGFPYLEQQLEQYKDVEKNERQVLFLSQGTVGKDLSKFAKDVAERMPDHYFIYKLHPGEYDRWKNEYPELIEAQKLNNFEVIDNNDVNLYQWFAESEFQVGVYSTAIFEGLTLGCKTVLVDLPGIEYVQDLIDKHYVLKADDESDLKIKIENHQVKSFDRNYFFQ